MYNHPKNLESIKGQYLVRLNSPRKIFLYTVKKLRNIHKFVDLQALSFYSIQNENGTMADLRAYFTVSFFIIVKDNKVRTVELYIPS